MKTYPKPQQGLSPKNFLLSDFLSKDEVFHIARVSITSSKDLSFHSHNYAELLWIESGEGIHHINGYNLPIRKNDMVMIRPQDKHNFTAKGKQLTLVNIAFPKESLDYFRCRYFPKTNLYFWTKSPLPFQMTLPDELIRRISTKAEETMLCKRSYLQLDSLLLFIFQQISINESELNYTDAPLWLVNAIQEFNKAGVYKDGSALFMSTGLSRYISTRRSLNLSIISESNMPPVNCFLPIFPSNQSVTHVDLPAWPISIKNSMSNTKSLHKNTEKYIAKWFEYLPTVINATSLHRASPASSAPQTGFRIPYRRKKSGIQPSGRTKVPASGRLLRATAC